MKEYIVRYEPEKITFDREIVRCKDCKYRHILKRCAVRHPDWFCRDGVKDEITLPTGQTYDKSANYAKDIYDKDIVEQIEKHVERIKAETDKNPDSLWSKGMRSFDGWEKQITSKLNNLDDFLLREKSKDCKEQKSKLESDTISRQAAIEAVRNINTIVRPILESDDEPLIDKAEAMTELMMLPSALPPVEPKIYGDEHNCKLTMFGECSYFETGCGSCEVVEKLINALKGECPPVEPKPVCEDAISRADAIKAVEAKIKWFDGDAIEDRYKRYAFIQVLDEILTELPQVEPERPKGKWIPDTNGYWKCSECGLRVLVVAKGNYCPNCGAKMEVTRNE